MADTRLTETDAGEGMTAQEAYALFEREARRWLGMSAEEFSEKYDSGFWSNPDASADVMWVQGLREFAH